MNTVMINLANDDDFFRHGRRIAQLADQQKELCAENTISFEDPVDLLKLLTPHRLALFRAIKDHPGPIVAIAGRLGRTPDSVQRDTDELELLGLAQVEQQVVRLAAEHIKLEAILA
ncbi:transcriptional regulator [Janthinobacterium sp. HH01]|uniref:HVO_A0114 family putative DNA-binding protein n=1 Tax=Janthinobacterium sp. HH01 TaxID=1198452 RepID=UPI0002AEBD00|nr:transcriptional regulator [Janthinobacterium sp. HH01]ELX11939.1 transcriptional regulator [Janthinobacterium sp. HH01]